jgi:hypothetical protein
MKKLAVPNPTSLSLAPRATRTVIVALVAFAMVVIAVLGGVPARAADGDDAAGVSLRPADSTGAFDGRNNFRYQADPGQTVQDYAAVVNTGTAVNDFTLIGTDAFNDERGDYALLDTADEPTLVGRWVTFENGTNRMKVTLQPGEGRLVPFTLSLPADATPGDHAGGIVASVLSADGQVQVDHRVAIRLYARVSGDLQPSLTISSLNASYDGEWWDLLAGRVDVHYTVTNKGNVALAANVKGGVNTWFGIPLTSDSGGIKEILPGNSASYEFQVPGIGQWGYLAPSLQITPFVDSEDTSTYVIAAPSSRDTLLLVVPWIPLIVLLGSGLVIASIVLYRRRENARSIEWMEAAEKRVREETLAETEGELQKAARRGD